MSNDRVFAMSFAGVYPRYVVKAEKKGADEGRGGRMYSLADGLHAERP